MVINLANLLWGLLVIAGIVALVSLAVLFLEVKKTVGQVNKNLSENQDEIDRAIKKNS